MLRALILAALMLTPFAAGAQQARRSLKDDVDTYRHQTYLHTSDAQTPTPPMPQIPASRAQEQTQQEQNLPQTPASAAPAAPLNEMAPAAGETQLIPTTPSRPFTGAEIYLRRSDGKKIDVTPAELR